MLEALLIVAAAAQTVPSAPPAQAVPSAEDPLAQARAGKVRCIQPNAVRRNCASIIRFEVYDDGNFDATVTGFLERGPEVLIVYRMSGTVEGPAVCSTVRVSDFLAGRFYVSGKLATAQQEEAIRERIRLRMADVTGKRRCFIDQQQNGQTVANVTLNGVVQTDQRQRVAWVARSDGYALGD